MESTIIPFEPINGFDSCILQNNRVTVEIDNYKKALKYSKTGFGANPELHEYAARQLSKPANKLQTFLNDPNISQYNRDRILKVYKPKNTKIATNGK